jgi:hypothetical protein
MLWIGGTAIQDMSGSPRPTDSMDKAQAFFADSGNAGATAFNSGMSILAALALLWFAGLMAGFLRQRGRPGSAPDIVLLGGDLAAGTLTSALPRASPWAVRMSRPTPLSPRRCNQLVFWTGGPLHVAPSVRGSPPRPTGSAGSCRSG